MAKSTATPATRRKHGVRADAFRVGRATRTVEVTSPDGLRTIEEGTIQFDLINEEDHWLYDEDEWIDHCVAPGAENDALEHPYIVILDEAGQIDDDGVLKTLHEIRDVTLFCIVNEYRPFLRSLEMGVESRLEGYKDIEFEGYTEDQLCAILEGRIEHGVADGVVSDDTVALLAEVSKHDARRAIDNLRRSVHEVRDNGLDRVTPSIVRGVVTETERELIKTTFSKLSRDQRILYEILVEDGGRMAIGDVHDRFLERVGDADPASKKTAKRELKKLSHYHIVDYRGENSARRYWAATDELYPEGAGKVV